MGYGEVVGNESVHWTVVYEDQEGRETGSVRGRDPIKFGAIGGKPPGKKRLVSKIVLSKPNFRVRLMFPSKDAAQRAKESAEIVEMDGSVFLLINAPAVRRKKEQVDPPAPPAEVRIDW